VSLIRLAADPSGAPEERDSRRTRRRLRWPDGYGQARPCQPAGDRRL